MMLLGRPLENKGLIKKLSKRLASYNL